ncbi:MAG: FRG domain-containing protein, partial [Oscillospiraceae bacterium]
MPPKPVLDHICQALLPALMKRSKKVPAVSIGYKDFGRDDIVFCGVAGFEQALNLFWGILVHSMGAGHHDFFESRPSQDFNPCAPGFFSHGARRQFSSAYALLQQAEALLAPGDHDFLREVLAFYYCTKNPDECDGASLAQIIRLAQASNQYLTNTFHEVTAFLKTGLGSHYTVVPDDAGGAYLTRGATFQVRTIVKKRSGFIDFLDEIGPAQLEDDTGNSRLFFRGQSTLAYSYAPSLYRRAGWRENESELLFDVISKKPEVFTDCPTTFEKLTKVQHYSLPTRLLDFSSNPMVGLKFACGVKEDAVDGELMIVKIPRPALKRFGSNRVCILSTLATFTHENQEQLFYWAVLSYVIDLAGLNADSRVLQSTLATAEQTLHALFGKPVALKAASVQALYRQLKKQIRFGHDMLRIDALEAKNGTSCTAPAAISS